MNVTKTDVARIEEVLLWLATKEDGEPLKKPHPDFAETESAVIENWATRFLANAGDELIEAALDYVSWPELWVDAVLTANGHGAGFWDGRYSPDGINEGAVGKALTRSARATGGIEAYLGDDQMLYVYVYK